MGRAGSGPEFHVNFWSGRVGSLYLWVGLGRVNKIRPTSNSDFFCPLPLQCKGLTVRYCTENGKKEPF